MIGFRHPFLMHAILAVTQSHDFTLQHEGSPTEWSTHWHHAISLLNSVLSSPLNSEARDAVWLSSSLVSVVYFARITRQGDHQSDWPLTPPALDFTWLRLCEAKRLAAALTNPLREDSQVRDMASEVMVHIAEMERVVAIQPPGPSALPDALTQFLQFHFYQNDLYHTAVLGLSEIYRLSVRQESFLQHLSFLSILVADFRRLLELRDAKALLILLYWHVRTCELRIWWMWKHAWTEGTAICKFLSGVWESLPELLTLLTYPRAMLLTNKP